MRFGSTAHPGFKSPSLRPLTWEFVLMARAPSFASVLDITREGAEGKPVGRQPGSANKKPSPGVRDAADHGGTYTGPLNNQNYPRVQVTTIKELLGGARPKMPPPLPPYIQ